MENVGEDFQIKYLEPALMKHSFLWKSLSDTQRMEKVKTYFKYTIIRHPLEKLLSAYLDKIKPPLNSGPAKWVENLKIAILQRFQSEEYKRWSKSRSYPLNISFPVYVRWITETKEENLNEHFVPVISSIYPCRIKYDFYGNFKQLSTDMGMVIDKLQAPHEYFSGSSYHRSGKETMDFLQSFYSQLDQDLKRKLFHILYQDLDFYYHLYPEERTSHCELLDIDELIPL